MKPSDENDDVFRAAEIPELLTRKRNDDGTFDFSDVLLSELRAADLAYNRPPRESLEVESTPENGVVDTSAV